MSKTVVVSEPNGNGKQNIEVISKSGIDDGVCEVHRKNTYISTNFKWLNTRSAKKKHTKLSITLSLNLQFNP